MPAKRSSTTRSRVQCGECDKSFCGTFELKRHAVLHSKDKSKHAHKCPFPDCGHAALQKSNLQTHINSVHLKIRTNKCTIFPGVCNADFCEASSLIRHEKNAHGWYRKDGKFRPVERSARKPRVIKSAGHGTHQQPVAQDQLSSLLSLDTLLSMSPSSSPSSSPSDSFSSDYVSSDYFSPSPSPDLPTPDAFQLEYTQPSIVHDFSAESFDAFNSTSFDPLLFEPIQHMSLTSASTSDFVQGNSATICPPPPSEFDLLDVFSSFAPDLTSFGAGPSPPAPFHTDATDNASSQVVEAHTEWMSPALEPLLSEFTCHSSFEFSDSMPSVNASRSTGFDLSTTSIDFDSLLQDIGVEDRLLESLGFF
ncbi:hypothetical protein SCHPADRAFT_895272 [Schizopora paradoxa]|uniref:C2H2-type domain-containing protein n=1 Tax=Schizopora paradoxa TaxID=27342 RepID=A0A0H2R5K5_9AGAM|nr:hypothetical protein SCHPADRAFT_895272 [Schizopora paradoxa]